MCFILSSLFFIFLSWLKKVKSSPVSTSTPAYSLENYTEYLIKYPVIVDCFGWWYDDKVWHQSVKKKCMQIIFKLASSQSQPRDASPRACYYSAVRGEDGPWWALVGLWTRLPADWEQRYSCLPGTYGSIWHTRLRSVAQWQPLLASVHARVCVCVCAGLGIWESSSAAVQNNHINNHYSIC